jgi:hypothetical protein
VSQKITAEMMTTVRSLVSAYGCKCFILLWRIASGD